MNLLFRVLYAQKCTSTHHKLAMDALRYLRAGEFEDWARLFLSEVQFYMDGAKAPDTKFKDFRNHVLHVSDNFWGGAVLTAEQWYARLVEQLKAKDWQRAVYCAGVLSHYVTDPLMPLHTGQTEDEAQVHKFIEWGTARIYEQLVCTHDAARSLMNWRHPEYRISEDWLALLIIEGAELSHKHYDVMIDHYDPTHAKKDPTVGFDTTSRASIAKLLGWSIRAMAFVIDQAIIESNVTPPKRSLAVSTVLSGMSTPLLWITRKLADKADRVAVQKIWDELQQTGKVINSLPEDDRTIRAAHAKEVLGITLEQLDAQPVRKAGSQHESGLAETISINKARDSAKSSLRFYLELDSPVVDAPSIGPKTAARLHQIDIHTVEQLVDANPDDAADQLDQSWITEDVFIGWQQQATMMCRVPGLRGHDAQLLVEVGVTRPEELANVDANDLLAKLTALAETAQGERILRSSNPPDLDEVERWIGFASQARILRAA